MDVTDNERVLALLSDRLPHSHHEIYGLFVVGHSRIADLRRQGHVIERWNEGRTSVYRLVSSPDPRVVGEVAAETATAPPDASQPGGAAQQLSLDLAMAYGLCACGYPLKPEITFWMDDAGGQHSNKGVTCTNPEHILWPGAAAA